LDKIQFLLPVPIKNPCAAGLSVGTGINPKQRYFLLFLSYAFFA